MSSKNRPERTGICRRRLAGTVLAVMAAVAGAGAFADHGTAGIGDRIGFRQWERPFHAPVRPVHVRPIRVQVPVSQRGPETLPLRKMIRRNSGLDMSDYRLVAVVVRNGRWSNGYASLRTGNRKSGRYFLGGHSRTRIPAPGSADRKWRLRLGPGTQVRSVTAILEPRRKAPAQLGSL